jgi:hypothetical protein
LFSNNFFRNISVAFLMFSVITLGSALFFYMSWEKDNRIIAEFARTLLGNGIIDVNSIDKLNGLVYKTQGFAQNKNYYLFQKLGPTPVQILAHGGDCSDKSRLVSAILSEYDVRSTLVMLHPCETCASGHTVVEAEATDGLIVVDPVYGFGLPKKSGGFYDLHALRSDPSILKQRLSKLVSIRGSADKIARYNQSDGGSHYGFPRTINWKKNAVLSTAKDLVGVFVKYPEFLYRPRFMEDPKLFLTLFSAFVSLMFMTAAAASHYFYKRRNLGDTPTLKYSNIS